MNRTEILRQNLIHEIRVLRFNQKSLCTSSYEWRQLQLEIQVKLDHLGNLPM